MVVDNIIINTVESSKSDDNIIAAIVGSVVGIVVAAIIITGIVIAVVLVIKGLLYHPKLHYTTLIH